MTELRLLMTICTASLYHHAVHSKNEKKSEYDKNKTLAQLYGDVMDFPNIFSE